MNNKEIAERVVDRMLDTIKAEGYLPWTKPWSLDKNRVRVIDGYTEITVPVRFWSRSGKPYNGINVLLLGMSGHAGEFITFKQAKAEGGQIKKGAKCAIVDGHIEQQRWTKDGQNRSKVVIIVDDPIGGLVLSGGESQQKQAGEPHNGADDNVYDDVYGSDPIPF